MRGLTVCQPFASLIAAGAKPVENRTWPTSYRGALLIHAGKSRKWLGEHVDVVGLPDPMPFGVVVAVARLHDCRRLEELPSRLRVHEHASGPWCWILRDVAPLSRPVPWRGALGLWGVPAELRRKVRRAA